MDVLVATDFFTTEVWTLGGLVTYYVLFFIQLGSRQVHMAGVTLHPHDAVDGAGGAQRHHGGVGVPHPGSISSMTVTPSSVPPLSRSSMMQVYPRTAAASVALFECVRGALGAIGQRGSTIAVDAVWRSVRCIMSSPSMSPIITRSASSGQGQCASCFLQSSQDIESCGPIKCRERLGGLLKYYHRKAA